MSLYERVKSSSLNSDNESNLTARQFLGKEKTKFKIYDDPKTFLGHLGCLNEGEFDQLDQSIGFMGKKTRINGSLFKRTDRTGREYLFPEFLRGRGTTGVKLVIDPGIEAFLNLYIDNKINFDFTMEDLINEAMKEG